MGIASAFRLRSASYGGQVAPPILRASRDLSCEVATCRGRSVDQRTDTFTPGDVVFSPWLKTSGQNLIRSPKRQRRSLRPARCPRVQAELPRSNCCDAENRHCSTCCRLTRNRLCKAGEIHENL